MSRAPRHDKAARIGEAFEGSHQARREVERKPEQDDQSPAQSRDQSNKDGE